MGIRFGGLLESMASARLTVLAFLLTAAAAYGVSKGWGQATMLMGLPFGLLAVNLVAAVLARPRFRRDGPLLIAHLAMIAMVSLFIVGRLTYFDGMAVLSTGAPFAGEFDRSEQGPWHGNGHQALKFANLGFADATQGSSYRATQNRVAWIDEPSGAWHEAEITPDRPLKLGGYRIYPTRFRGYSARFLWVDSEGVEHPGVLPLPRVGMNAEFPEGAEWQLRDGVTAWVQLQLDEAPPAGVGENLGVERLSHRLVFRVADQREVLQVGDRIAIQGGRLSYLGLDAWMGYRIVWDRTESWLGATVIVLVASLCWYYWPRLRRPD